MSSPDIDPEKQKRIHRRVLWTSLIGFAVLAVVTALIVAFGSDAERPITQSVSPGTDEAAPENNEAAGY